MPQFISLAAQSSTEFDTLVASPLDFGNIQEAFIYYHYGVANKNEQPAQKSIHSYLKDIQDVLFIEEPRALDLLERYNILEDLYLGSSGSLQNISDVTIFEGISASTQNLNLSFEQFEESFNIIKKYVYASFNVINSSYTLDLSDNRKMIIVDSVSDIDIFVPSNIEKNFSIGTNLEIINIGTGKCFVKENNDVLIRNNPVTEIPLPDLNWTTVTSNFGNTVIQSIAYGNSLWVAGGFPEPIISFDPDPKPTESTIQTSTDTVTWTTVASNFGNAEIFSIAYGNSLWIAGGFPGQMRTSTDGATWTTVTSNFGNTQINSIFYGNDLWIAAGYSGQMRTSTDGTTWTTVTSNFGNTTIRSISHDNDLWVAGGNYGQMRTSTNGSTWTTVTSNFGNTIINSIFYGNDLWVAAGYSGQMRTSTNGSTWTTVTSNFDSTPIRSLSYGNNIWVAGGNYGQMRTSTDGTTWTTVTSNFGTTNILSIAYGNSTWLAGGINGQIRSSPIVFDKIYENVEQCLIYKRQENDWVIIQ